MAKVYWDANLFIYLFEGGPNTTRVEEIRRGMIERGDTLYTSTMAAGEVMAGPLHVGREDVWEAYRRFFGGPGLSLLPFDFEAAPHYSRIRQDSSVARADAFHFSCAAAVGIDLFITNDNRLTKKRVPDVAFLTSLAAAPY